MLIRQFPEQIVEVWDFYVPLIAESLPPTVKESRNGIKNILTALLLEKGQLWLSVDSQTQSEPKGLVVTHFQHDPMTRQKFLLVYAINAFGPMKERDFYDGLATLKKFARKNGANSLMFYISDGVMKLYEKKFDFESSKNVVKLSAIS